MRVCVIGTGYVGLVTGPCLSDLGHHVVCVDKDVQKIENLNKNIVPIYEPSLEELITQCVKADRLSFTTSLKTGMAGSDVIIIAVGTPPCEETGQADLKYIEQAAAEIAENIDGYCVVTTKSTVPVGTSDKVASIIERVRPDLKRGVDFDVASNPEFLREGSAISDFMKPDRISPTRHKP